MLSPYYTFLILFGVLSPCLYAKRPLFYRKDYTYIEAYDAFYKMHWDSNVDSWSSAFKVCDDEGAQLFYPKIKDEWTVAQKLSQNLSEQSNATNIFLGLHNQFQLGEFITIDGHSTETPLGLEDSTYPSGYCIMMDITTGKFSIDTCSTDNPTPFICKKVEDISCPTIDRGYKYVKLLNKCYKVHKKQMDWNGAMQTCYLEGGLLAVLETDSEINAVRPLVKSDTNYFIGFKKMFNSSEFYTVKGKIFENSFLTAWYRQEDNEHSDCGVFYYSAYQIQNQVKVAHCNSELNFICEMSLN